MDFLAIQDDNKYYYYGIFAARWINSALNGYDSRIINCWFRIPHKHQNVEEIILSRKTKLKVSVANITIVQTIVNF